MGEHETALCSSAAALELADGRRKRVDLLLNCGYIDMRIKHGGAGRALRVRVTHAGLGGGCLDSAG